MAVLVPALLLIGLVTAAVIAWRSRHAGGDVATAATLRSAALVAAVVSVLILTMWPAAEGVESSRNVNLIPFRDVLLATRDRAAWSGALADVAGNVAVFIPLGMALTARFRGFGAARVVGVVVALSVGIEAVQATLGTGRATDVTDVLMNGLGALVGYHAWRALSPDDRAAGESASRLH